MTEHELDGFAEGVGALTVLVVVVALAAIVGVAVVLVEVFR